MSLITKDTPAIRRLAIDPWPFFYFLFSFMVNTAMGYGFSIFYAVTWTCVLILLGQWAPLCQKAVIGISGLIATCYFPFGTAWGAPNFNTLLALHATNVEESTEMLTIFPWHSYAISVFILGLTIIALRRERPLPRRRNWTDALLLLITIPTYFVGPVHNYLTGWDFKVYETGYPVIRFVKDVIVNNYAVGEEKDRMQSLASKKDAWQITAVQPKYHIYVVVIGESARRDALGAFGGHWDNTPFASHANGTFYSDYISASGSTQKSLGLTLNRVEDGKPQYQDSIVTLANRAGFQTWWFSNQGQIGEYDTAIASIAHRADQVNFLKNGDFEANKNSQDTQLLNMTAQVLATRREPNQLIVLHLMGSHPQACDRTQGKMGEFVQSKETSCYIESITQTDNLLGQLYNQLRQSGESFSMVYFSDHGLTFRERGTRVQYLAHDDKFQQNFQVPFMVLSSDDKTHKIIKARRSANDFLKFFAQWTGIATTQVKPDYPFASEKKAGPVYITNFNLQKVDYNHLGTDIFETHTR